MPAIARVGIDMVPPGPGGGLVIGNLAPTVRINGSPVACLGAAVAGHGPAIHSVPVMAQASSTVRANGIPICRAGDQATCGDPVGTCSPNVFAG